MSKIQILKGFLGLQILSPIVIVALLKFLKMPAEGAGALFILVGMTMIVPMLKWSQYKVSALFWATIVYVLVGSALYAARLAHWGSSYESFSLFGLPASFFHHTTEALYITIFALTLVELFKVREVKVE